MKRRLSKILGIIMAAIVLFVSMDWLYTVIVIRQAIAQAAYVTPEDGLLARAAE